MADNQTAGRRKRTAIVDLRVRMREPLRSKIAAASKRKGTSLNTEAIDRPEQSFRDDRVLSEIVSVKRIVEGWSNV